MASDVKRRKEMASEASCFLKLWSRKSNVVRLQAVGPLANECPTKVKLLRVLSRCGTKIYEGGDRNASESA